MTTVLTKPFNAVKNTASALLSYQDVLTQLEDVKARMNKVAKQDGYDSAFDDKNEIIHAYLESEDAETYLDLSALAEANLRAKQKAKRATKVSAVVGAGALAGGIALRQAHKKGWTVKGFRRVNRLILPPLTTRQYGPLAGQIVKLILSGNDHVLVQANEEAWTGKLAISKRAFVLTEDNASSPSIHIAYDQLQAIELERDATGDITRVAITISDYRVVATAQQASQQV